MFIDTHAHLGMIVKQPGEHLTEEHFQAIEVVIQGAQVAGVAKIMTIGADVSESADAVKIAERFPTVFATVGIHPCDCSQTWLDDVKQIDALIRTTEPGIIVAVGEIGLDFYHKPFDKQRQLDALKCQIELALEHRLPLVVHVRDAGEELLYALEPYVKQLCGGVIHCFSQNHDFARTVVGWGLYCGIDAPVGYPKNEVLREIIRDIIPLDKILLETDAPFLPPFHLRGKKNLPAYIPQFAQVVGALKGVDEQAFAAATTANAHALFGLER